MFKRIWYLIFNKKEKIMPTTTEEIADTRLENLLQEQKHQIGNLHSRLSVMKDEMTSLKRDLTLFKQGVADDLTKIVERVNEKR